MGTSQSSSGSPSGVPLVPPWVPDVTQPSEQNYGADNPGQDTSAATDQESSSVSEIALAGRWRRSRQNIGEFARSGDGTDMRRGIGHYVGGLGGAPTGTRRFGGTTQTAGRLYGALSGLTGGGQAVEPPSPLDPTLLEGRTAREIMDAIIETVRPVDGTQDAEASRRSINEALSELMERFPEANLLQLSQEQREFAIERFVAHDVYLRFNLDVGVSIKSKAPSTTVALSRLREVKDYIRETVAASFRRLRNAGQRLRSGGVAKIVNHALQTALEIFEEYVK